MRRIVTLLSATAILTAALAAPAAGIAPARSWDEVIIGDDGNNTLVGTAGADKIKGKGGDDLLQGRKKRDLLQGGTGNDMLQGGGAKDKLYGGPGADRLTGGPGNDLLHGGPGKDRLLGGQGNDTLRSNGDKVSDNVDCGAGLGDVAYVDARDIVTGCETVNVVSQSPSVQPRTPQTPATGWAGWAPDLQPTPQSGYTVEPAP